MPNPKRWNIKINGTVQGVGFRPFVYRLATERGLSGHVFNHSDGVTIEAQGDEDALKAFVDKIKNDPPPLAHIHEIKTREIGTSDDHEFSIIESARGARASTLISPDIAPCEDCVLEMRDTNDRRFGYPFINCTNCGPRYSIIQNLPYDRPKTTMKAFEMCRNCRGEYEDPSNRRFHAEPNACEKCGPRLAFIRDGDETPDSPIGRVLAALTGGEIAAIKGLGGFHLACDAASDKAVKRLRQRKRRDEKPFAIMVGDIETARSLCHISDSEEKLLTSPQRPIVLLRKKDGARISELVAPGNKNLGVMLPSTPLHSLIFSRQKTEDRGQISDDEPRATNHERRVLVMTSGNISDEPIAFEDEEAFEKLTGIADAFLTHNRDIHVRIDDSIARCIDDRPVLMRRARGYAPAPIRLKFNMPQILATGADLKNAICLTKGKNAFLSQYLGDMENAEANRSLDETAKHMKEILDITPEIIACDMHPDYFSMKVAYAHSLPDSVKESCRIQHHHAHIASCMAENDLPNEKVIGIALDGTGYGTDGTIWGGEILVADYNDFERAAHFAKVKMPGGDAAARQPWRMAVSYLRHAPCAMRHASFKEIPDENVKTVIEMIDKDINCPKTSSCGRLFDAVAALIGLRVVNTFEGQAAMELEQLADEGENGVYGYEIAPPERSHGRLSTVDRRLILDFAPTISAILHDLESGIDGSIISMRFHNTIISALADVCTRIYKRRATSDLQRVCLSGGCFQNAILTTGLKKKLVDKGFTVYTHSLVPPNDGGIALGQAAIATHLCRGKTFSS